jgi:hypothetical protein
MKSKGKFLAVALLGLSSHAFAGDVVKEIPFNNAFVPAHGQLWAVMPVQDYGKTVVCIANTIKSGGRTIYGYLLTLNLQDRHGNSEKGMFELDGQSPANFIFYDVQPVVAGSYVSILFKDPYDIEKVGYTVSCVYQVG